MKFILFNLVVFILSSSAFAQEESPVTWSTAHFENADKSVNLVFMATIKDGWHLYSQTLDSDKGPIPTSFIFSDNKNIELIGKTEENPPRVKYDSNFEMDIAMFSGQAMFSQKLLPKSESVSVSGKISFMVCNDEKCIFPPEREFLFTKEGKAIAFRMVK